MSENAFVIDGVLAEFERREEPVQLGRNVELTRQLRLFKPFWETTALTLAKTFKPSRLELVRRLRGRINLDRRMVLQTMAGLLREEYAKQLVAAGENEDMAKIVAEILVPLSFAI